MEGTFSLRNTFVEFAISIFHQLYLSRLSSTLSLSNVLDRILLGTGGRGGGKVLRFATECENQTSLNIQKGR